MPQDGAYTLAEAPATIVIECPVCGRRGIYSRDRLIARHGGDLSLPALKDLIVKPRCSKARDITHFGGCQARFGKETIKGLLV
jgi:hypothetical protein